MLLHEHSNFKDLIVVVSGEMGIDPTLVEKDYWIMQSRISNLLLRIQLFL